MDRGRDAILPVVDELRAALADDHKLLILTGAGIRARHVLGVALDLGLPTGALAELAATEAEQNGHLLAALLAEHGVSYLPHHAVARQLAVHLAAAPAVVANGYPPFGVFEPPPAVGTIPPHRTDAGTFLIADTYGARRTIYVKDVDGVFTADPHGPADPSPELRDKVSAAELLHSGTTLPIDRVVLERMGRAKHVREIQIVNGLTAGALTRALRGEPVGTVVHAG
jgi:molybdenum storage protein